MDIQDISVYRVNMPLDRTYPLSFNAVDMAYFDAIVVEVTTSDERTGWGEVTILPGYTHETVDSGWRFNCGHAEQLVGRDLTSAKRHLIAYVGEQPHAASPIMTAIEMLEGNPILEYDTEVRVPVLAPVRAMDDAGIEAEVPQLLERGHKRLKIKIGFDAEKDLKRIRFISQLVGGFALLRVDANQGYSREEGRWIGERLDPGLVEWLEQPCDRFDWESNAAVAKDSAVPVMLDESIYSFEDIQHAAGLEGVAYIKHVLEKYSGLDMLKAALDHIRLCGMQPVLGNGGATDITSWLEASVARLTVDVPCEFHGFLKVKEPLLDDPLPFENGDVILRPGYRPSINRSVLEAYTTQREHITGAV